MLMARTVQDSMQFRRSKWRLPQKGIQRPCVEGQGRCEQHAYRLEDATVKQRGTGVKEQETAEISAILSAETPSQRAAARLQARWRVKGRKPPFQGDLPQSRKRFLGATVAAQNHTYVHMLYLHDDVA